jgi:hypothetical protein
MTSEVMPTASELVAKARRNLGRLMLLQIVWFLCFVGGGVFLIWTFWKNSSLPGYCSGGFAGSVLVPASACVHQSYLWPVVLMGLGIVGLMATGYVATRLAFRYLGQSAVAFLRGGRRQHTTMGGPGMGGFPGSPSRFPGPPGGFPGLPGGASSPGGFPPVFNEGLPPGAPGSPTGPPPP